MHPRHRRSRQRGPGRPDREPRRAGVSLMVAMVVVLTLAWWRAPGDAPHPPAAAPSAVTQDVAPVEAGAGVLRDPHAEPAAVLAAWDAARARAYVRGSSATLARLYLPGAVPGRRDVRLLADYAARGLRVRGMRMEVTHTEVLRSGPRTRVLRVTDRLVGARAVRLDGTSYPLPRDRPSTRTVRLVHHGGAWRVAAVGPAG